MKQSKRVWNSTLIKIVDNILISMRGLMIQENANFKLLNFYRIKLSIIAWIILCKTKINLIFHVDKPVENKLIIIFSKILMVLCKIIKVSYKQDKMNLITYEIYRNHNIAYIMNNINNFDIINDYLTYECKGNMVYDNEGFQELITNNTLYENLWNQISCLMKEENNQ